MAFRVTLHCCVKQQDFGMLKTLLDQKVADIEAVDDREWTALNYAVCDGWEAGVNLLLERGANVETKDTLGSTPLHQACSGQNHEIVDLLLDFGANVNSVNFVRQTPLHVISCSKDVHLAEKLLRRGAEINLQDKNGNSPLSECCQSGNEHVMLEFLLKNGADIELKNSLGMSPLLIVCKAGNVDLVTGLIVKKADVNSKDVDGNTALHFASCLESTNIVKLLLGARSKLDCRNKLNETPLLYALKYLHKQYLTRYQQDHDEPTNELVVFYLIQRGAEVNVQGKDEKTPLFRAVCAGNINLVKKLLVNGAEVNVKNKKRNTPLHCDCRRLCTNKITTELIAYGADVNARNRRKETPLHVASRFGNEGTITKLLREGADVNLKDKDDNTPLILFCHKRTNGGRDISSVSLFLKYDADVNVCNKKMDTPLIYAALHQNSLAVEELLMANADVNAKTCFGDTPLHLACRRTSFDSIKLLLNNGADVNVANNKGDTPLHAAADSYVFSDILNIIFRRVSPNVHYKNNKGETALHLSGQIDCLEAVKLLLFAGSNVNEVDNDGNTPFHRMLCSFDSYTIKEFLSWGASVLLMNKNRTTPLGMISKSYGKVRKGNGVKRYIIMSKAASLTLEYPLDVNLYFGFDHLANFQVACFLEVDRMKARRLGVNCVFDILSKYRDPTYLSNSELEHVVENLEQQPTEFPIYNSLLTSTYRRAKQRLVLMNKAETLLHIPLPHEILRRILVYLDDRYLGILTKDE